MLVMAGFGAVERLKSSFILEALLLGGGSFTS